VNDTYCRRRLRHLLRHDRGSVAGPFLEFVLTIAVSVAIALAVRTWVVQPYVVPTGSMLPTIQLGDHVLANKFIYDFTTPQPGQVVVFDDPTKTVPTLIKRVIAVGGQTVEVRDGYVFVDGKKLDEPYTGSEPTEPGPLRLPLRVPAGDVWAMGDNRTNSEDSRWFGPVPDSTIRGEAFVIYWPLSRLGGGLG
jgi:signal peptidase I